MRGLKYAGLLLLVLFVGTSCSGTPPTPTPAPTSAPASPSTVQPSCVAKGCDGKEVTEVHCDVNAQFATLPQHMIVGKVHGMITIRKASPGVCSNLYWTWFAPDSDSTGNFTLTLERNDTPMKAQESAPGNPTLTAWTVGGYAEPGTKIAACLRSGSEQQCVPSKAS